MKQQQIQQIRQDKLIRRHVAARELQKKATLTQHFQKEFETNFGRIAEIAHWHINAVKQ